ncbi:MAG: hypothetical protein MUE67_01185 [Anaerolineales bacterium]|nr:hypothetical protein [Anaerolineales bacterium]
MTPIPTQPPEWQDKYEAELRQARSARANQKEGMARVCARRAVGIVIGIYLSKLGYQSPSNSAYDRLRFLIALPDLPEDSREVARHFLVKVDPDYRLPINVDLLAEAEWLRQALLPD